MLPGLPEERVSFGISAGSAMVTPGRNYDPDRLECTGVSYYDECEEVAPRNAGSVWAWVWSTSRSART
jgi:hypothetical protein